MLHFEPNRGEPFTREVEPGDLLVVYNMDGVTEAAKPAGEAYGIERLTALARRHAGHGVETLAYTRKSVSS